MKKTILTLTAIIALSAGFASFEHFKGDQPNLKEVTVTPKNTSKREKPSPQAESIPTYIFQAERETEAGPDRLVSHAVYSFPSKYICIIGEDIYRVNDERELMLLTGTIFSSDIENVSLKDCYKSELYNLFQENNYAQEFRDLLGNYAFYVG